MDPPLLHVIAWFQRDQSCDVMGRRIFSAIFGRNGRRSERAREGITTVHEQDVLHGSPLSGHELGKINEAGGVTPFNDAHAPRQCSVKCRATFMLNAPHTHVKMAGTQDKVSKSSVSRPLWSALTGLFAGSQLSSSIWFSSWFPLCFLSFHQPSVLGQGWCPFPYLCHDRLSVPDLLVLLHLDLAYSCSPPSRW